MSICDCGAWTITRGGSSRLTRSIRKNPRVLRTVGALLYNFGEGDKAFEFYSKAIEVDPTEGFALYYRAREYRFKRKFVEAIADASALLAVSQAGLNDARSFLDEDGIVRDFRVKALLERAYSYQDSGRLDLAEKDYDAAVDVGRSAPALAARAHFLGFYVQRKDDALRDLSEAVHAEPRNSLRSMRSAFHLRDSIALRRLSRPSMPP